VEQISPVCCSYLARCKKGDGPHPIFPEDNEKESKYLKVPIKSLHICESIDKLELMVLQ